MVCEFSPLRFHLSASTKDKIWKGDYIDLLSLLPYFKDNHLDKKDSDKSIDDRCKSASRSFNNLGFQRCGFVAKPLDP